MLDARRVRDLFLDFRGPAWFNAYAYFEYGHDKKPLTADDVWRVFADRPQHAQEYAYGLLSSVPTSTATPGALTACMAYEGFCDSGTHRLLLELGPDADWLVEPEVVSLLGRRVDDSLERARKWLGRDFDSTWSEFVRVV